MSTLASPLDNAAFSVFKRYARRALHNVAALRTVTDTDVEEIVEQGVHRMRKVMPAFFDHCGWTGNATGQARIPPRYPSTVPLPFGEPPAGAPVFNQGKRGKKEATKKRTKPAKRSAKLPTFTYKSTRYLACPVSGHQKSDTTQDLLLLATVRALLPQLDRVPRGKDGLARYVRHRADEAKAVQKIRDKLGDTTGLDFSQFAELVAKTVRGSISVFQKSRNDERLLVVHR